MEKIAAIILAAGNSSRFGRAKQLVEFEGNTLLGRAIDAAVAVKCEPIIVIVGASASEIVAYLDGSGVRFTENPNWEQGIGSSIRAGIDQMQKTAPAASAVLLMVSDQPLVGERQLSRLVYAREKTGKPLVCSQYAETIGVPAIFGREFFGELMELDRAGAKKLLIAHSDQCVHVQMPEAERDIDIPADFSALQDESLQRRDT